MRTIARLTILVIGLGVLASAGTAQQPKDKKGGPPKGEPRSGGGRAFDADAFVARMMAFDKNKDGKLTRDEITDERLLRLFDQADADKDGVVTKEELTALAKKMAAEESRDGGGRRGGFGPPGGSGGRPQPGQILPGFLQDMLQLTPEQRKQVDDLQKEVNDKLEKILTEEQRKQFKDLRERGPGGFGPPGGPPGRPGEPPPPPRDRP